MLASLTSERGVNSDRIASGAQGSFQTAAQTQQQHYDNAKMINWTNLSYVAKTLEFQRLPLVLPAADSPLHTTAAYYDRKTFEKRSTDVCKTKQKRCRNGKLTAGLRCRLAGR